MKKLLLLLLVSATLTTTAQSNQVQNMINYLRNKDYMKAKASADAAAEHESTVNNPKMWKYRGDVYKAIYDTSARDLIDKEAEEKALEAYTRCLTLDKGKDIYKDDVKGPIVMAAAATNNKANYYIGNQEYDKAARCYDLLEKALPFDFSEGMKRKNITQTDLLFNRFEMYKNSGNKEKTIEYANKLMDISYKNPKLYLDMANLSLRDKDTTAALGYIEKGKKLFDDNMALITTEIDIYIARKKSKELIDKLKTAIEIAPDNEVLYAVLGQVYERSGDLAAAEQAYQKAIEIKPDYEQMNFKLGTFYFNQALEYYKKSGDLPPKEAAKAKEYDAKAIEYFGKAEPLMEKAYEVNPDKAYKQRLVLIYNRLGKPEKAAALK